MKRGKSCSTRDAIFRQDEKKHFSVLARARGPGGLCRVRLGKTCQWAWLAICWARRALVHHHQVRSDRWSATTLARGLARPFRLANGVAVFSDKNARGIRQGHSQSSVTVDSVITHRCPWTQIPMGYYRVWVPREHACRCLPRPKKL